MPTSDPHATQCDIARSLALHLRDLRERSGLTQEEVVERAGMAPNTYQRYERGVSKQGKPTNPTLSSLVSIACAFDVDVRELLAVEYDSSNTNTPELRAASARAQLPPAQA